MNATTFVNDTSNVAYASLSSLNYLNIFLALFGLGANILVLAFCMRNVRQHSYMWFIASLALADVLTCAGGIVSAQPHLLADNESLCRLASAIGVVTIGAVISSHPLLALNRYIAVRRSAWYPLLFENRYAVFGILLTSWAIPTSFCLIDYASGCLGRTNTSQGEMTCFFNAQPSQHECLLPKVIHFITCYVVVGICYWKLFSSLRHHQKQLLESGVGNASLAIDQQLLKLMALHALVPLCIHMPALSALNLFPELQFRYRFVVKILSSMFLAETILDSILTLAIVKLFRKAVLAGLANLGAIIFCNRSKITKTDVLPLDNKLIAAGPSNGANCTKPVVGTNHI